MIKAIETQYKGYYFRSRIEARWAVFFDHLGLRWEYEKEGYTLSDGTNYLPDFWLPDLCMRNKSRKGVWIEVKGAEPTKKDEAKCQMLAEGLNTNVLLVWGEVSAGPSYDDSDGFYEYSLQGWDSCMRFFTCYDCNKTKIEFDESNYKICPHCGGKADMFHPRLNQAVINARSSRF